MTTKSKILADWLANANAHGFNWRRHKALRDTFTQDVYDEIDRLQDEGLTQLVDRLFSDHPYWSFEPRENNTQMGDEQTAYIESRKRVTVAVGGNGSGKTHLAAIRAIDFLGDNPPPRPNSKFWVVSDTFPMSCGVCWLEKLALMLPEEWVDWDNISWFDRKRNYPAVVPLRKVDGKRNWILEFKSYEQGRHVFQAAGVGAVWFSEQVPWPIYEECMARLREPQFAHMPNPVTMEFTPLDPARSFEISEIYEKWLEDPLAENTEMFNFCRLNTIAAMEAGHVSAGAVATLKASSSDEQLKTRLAGDFASYAGTIYSLRPYHLTDGEEIPGKEFTHYRVIDWGSGGEHPFVCLWVAKSGSGRWIVYDELYLKDPPNLEDIAKDIIKRHHWDEQYPGIYSQTFCDPSEPGLRSQFGAWGLPMSAANNAVKEGIESVRVAMKIKPITGLPGLIIHRDRCPNTVREMRSYRWLRAPEVDTRINPAAPPAEPLKKDDHTCDALRYLIHTLTRRAGGGAAAIRKPKGKRARVRHRRG